MATREVPASVLNRIAAEREFPLEPTTELNYLLDKSFEARPLTIPGVGQIGIKDTKYAYHWVRLKRGNNPDETRYMQMKAAGYSNATIQDVDPLVNSVRADCDEVRCGVDLILMKASPSVHYGALKFHQLRALEMTNPRSDESTNRLMKSMDFESAKAMSDTRTYIPSAAEVSDRQTRAPGNSITEGSPAWNEIAKEASKKGGK
jgi:hypothetical protein